MAFCIHFGRHFGSNLEPSWPTILTLARSGAILAPFGRSSLRCKSGWTKSAVLDRLLAEGPAAGGRPLQLKLDSGQLWQGFHTADISKLMRRILRATPTAAGPSAYRQSKFWKTCKTSRKADQHCSACSVWSVWFACSLYGLSVLSVWSVCFAVLSNVSGTYVRRNIGKHMQENSKQEL